MKNSSKEEVSVSKDKEREGVFVEPLYLMSAGQLTKVAGYWPSSFLCIYEAR